MFIYNEDHTVTIRLDSGRWETYYDHEFDLYHFILTSMVRPSEELRNWGVAEINPIREEIQS